MEPKLSAELFSTAEHKQGRRNTMIIRWANTRKLYTKMCGSFGNNVLLVFGSDALYNVHIR